MGWKKKNVRSLLTVATPYSERVTFRQSWHTVYVAVCQGKTAVEELEQLATVFNPRIPRLGWLREFVIGYTNSLVYMSSFRDRVWCMWCSVAQGLVRIHTLSCLYISLPWKMVVQCVAVCCSVLQCVADICSDIHSLVYTNPLLERVWCRVV